MREKRVAHKHCRMDQSNLLGKVGALDLSCAEFPAFFPRTKKRAACPGVAIVSCNPRTRSPKSDFDVQRLRLLLRSWTAGGLVCEPVREDVEASHLGQELQIDLALVHAWCLERPIHPLVRLAHSLNTFVVLGDRRLEEYSFDTLLVPRPARPLHVLGLWSHKMCRRHLFHEQPLVITPRLPKVVSAVHHHIDPRRRRRLIIQSLEEVVQAQHTDFGNKGRRHVAQMNKPAARVGKRQQAACGVAIGACS
jgi:hypothetical protein